jgi:hypothetical protein
MSNRRVVTGATLVVLVGVLCVMAVWGYRAATAPMDSTDGTSSATPDCPSDKTVVTRFVTRGEVTVSVYNAGKRSGRARETLDLLEAAGFRPGEVNNAPDGVDVRRAAVYTTKSDDPAAQLVARTLGKKTPVVHSDDELGPGVDVVIGDRFKRLDPTAPKKLKLAKPITTCEE